MLANVSFANPETGLIYARLGSGRLECIDPEALSEAILDQDTRAGILAVAPDALFGSCEPNLEDGKSPRSFVSDRTHVLGHFGT